VALAELLVCPAEPLKDVVPDGEDDAFDWFRPGLHHFSLPNRAGVDLIADEVS
jgi:hypothetical protein